MIGRLLGRLGGGAGGSSIDVTEASRRHDAGEIVLIDVREATEVRGGSPRGARHVPLSRIGGRLDALSSGQRPVAFICRSGHRSAAACALARRHGIEAIDVRGGFGAWQRAGLPVSKA